MLNTLTSHHIADNDWYNAEMAKSLIDKIFFLDKVDAGMFVDFGCANGVMLGFIEKVFPGSKLVGFDTNPEMIEEARARDPNSKIIYTSEWDEVRELFKDHKATAPRGQEKVCVVSSSVGHEIESYSDEEAKALTYRRIWGEADIEWDYVAWRDMMASRAASRPSDPIAVARVQQIFEAKHPGLIAQWEQRWGHLGENWSLLHFFMTYRYVANWDREYRENYLPRNYEDFMASVPKKYMPIYQDRFTLPFLRRRVQEDFGISLSDTTHLKVVFELRK
ncbi:hypothetical protein OIU34_18950 [Pararhizobium sp. BT-229]|uniref:class I SAM-dependent methyltransferase n=1 Tax=Pararhizobium sp. BT-229 TaxID=2986923 RepID=UPI0021F6F699|nr:class I SAM-dependent methyltransferase [Pararhizobium sp. BT-229]MCV9963960.1 hypothetical protein [Pararhizobium sp. BT-229]